MITIHQLTRLTVFFTFQGGLGGAQAFAKSETLVNLLKKQRESNKPYGAICASPALVFEPHGLLKVCFIAFSEILFIEGPLH